jgi:hypothetical protein
VIAPAAPKRRQRAPLQVIVTAHGVRVPVAEFARGWAPVVALAAARLASRNPKV